MLWGQQLLVYTDHKNLMQDTLGLTCDRVYHWRLLLEEYDPEILCIIGSHSMVVDAISHLDFGPTKDNNENWMIFTKYLCFYAMHAVEDTSPSNHKEIMNFVFANRRKETAIYPLIVRKIAEAQT